MPKLNIVIDGTWLFRACGGGKVLSSKTERPDSAFSLNFAKLNDALIGHLKANDVDCDSCDNLFISTSIFNIPPDIRSWVDDDPLITLQQIEQVERGVFARQAFVNNALSAGYSNMAVFYPKVKRWTLKNLREGNFQEKQVDASVVALLVRSAVEHQKDYHAVITGDADIIPAIQVAYPEYTKNVLIVSTHPDELNAEHRQASFSLSNFNFDIPSFYLQDNVEKIIHGENIYRCAECNKVFVRPKPIPKNSRPYCINCHAKRT